MRAPEFWTGTSPAARLAAAALSPLGWAYGAGVALKAAQTKPYRAAARVLCVGNLTVGGTGKTPVVRAIAQQLMARRLRVFILSRGYGGRLRGPVLVDPLRHSAVEVGDEPAMLAQTAAVIVSRDRAAGARLADIHHADFILMDDGHQNFSLAKDLSLVLIDSEEGLGNGRVLPAGPLREPASRGLSRADAVVMVGNGNSRLPHFRCPVLSARLVPSETASFAGQRVIAFAGIGRPQKFFESLKSIGAAVIATRSFPDHHVYSTAELDSLRKRASWVNATLVTTEKDFVRISPVQRSGLEYLPVRAVFDDPDHLSRLLDSVMGCVGASL